MRDEKKHEYYLKNKEARKRYQRDYYTRNKRKILAKRALDLLGDLKLANKKRAYNRAYYFKNRARLKAQRLAKVTVTKARVSGRH